MTRSAKTSGIEQDPDGDSQPRPSREDFFTWALPHHEIELRFAGGRFADARTWQHWRDARVAQLWQVACLLCSVDPQSLDRERVTRPAFLAARFELLTTRGRPVDAGGFILLEGDSAAEHIVRLDRVFGWAMHLLLPVPASFPKGGPLRAQDLAAVSAGGKVRAQPKGSPVRAKPKKTRAVPLEHPEWLREWDLLEFIVPFSKATLWRHVRAGTFPAPVKLGPSFTAWRKDDILAWQKSPHVVISTRAKAAK